MLQRQVIHMFPNRQYLCMYTWIRENMPESCSQNTMRSCTSHLTRDQKKKVIFINKSGSSLWKKPVVEKKKPKQNAYKECHGAVSELNGNFLPFEQVSCLMRKHFFIYFFSRNRLTEMAQPLGLQAFKWTASLSQRSLTCVLPVTSAQENWWRDI